MVALGERGEPLDVGADEPGEGLGLCLAQLGHLLGDVLHRAVALAQLDAGQSVVADGADRGRVPVAAQGAHEGLRPLGRMGSGGLHHVDVALLETGRAGAGEGVDGVVSRAVAQEAHRLDRHVVVVGGQLLVPGLGNDPLACWSSPAALAGGALPGLDGTLGRELVEMAAHAGRGQAQVVSEAGGRDRPPLADRREDPVAGPRVVLGLGNNHTTMLRKSICAVNPGHPYPDGGHLDSPLVTAAAEVLDLHRTFGSVRAVRGATFRAEPGEITCILGPNGAGKTTTIECLEGLQRPDSGRVRVLGADPWHAYAAHRARVGVMLQDGGLPQAVTAGRLLDHLSRLHDGTTITGDLVDALEITPFAGTAVRRLSGGQRQRVALAAALLHRPLVAFLDEPSAGLDPHAQREVHALLRGTANDGAALVVTTHSFAEAERLADRVVIMHRGVVVAEGAPAEVSRGVTLEQRYFELTGPAVA